jgi:hypothetical protein
MKDKSGQRWNMKNFRVDPIGLSLGWALLALMAGCAHPAPTSTPSATSFRSNLAHLEAPLPMGWAAVEGPQSLARPFTGLVAFNSWGQAGFWAPEITTASGSQYDAGTVLKQMPAGGAYIVLVDQSGGPMIPELYGPEYQPADLSGLWSGKDCRAAAGGPNWQGFYKWGRYLILEVFCQPTASDATAAAVSALLAGWRFDRVPAGDEGWAVVTARALLPAAVEPSKFPINAGWSEGTGPEESSRSDGNVMRTTKTQVQGENIAVIFTYHWSVPLLADSTTGKSHWWQYEARPNGAVVMMSEGGDTLPSP